MNKEWSELNKTMLTELKKRGTFNQGMLIPIWVQPGLQNILKIMEFTK